MTSVLAETAGAVGPAGPAGPAGPGATLDSSAATAPGRAGTRRRADRREAILGTAFMVFAREGYAQATLDMIAAEARVAKHTIYNHFGDKQALLRAAIAAESDKALAKNLAAVDGLRDLDGDVRVLLEDVGYRLIGCFCDERGWALRRLLYAEINQFPDLLDIIQGRAASPVTEALADRLARLALAGRLRLTDPAAAAEQLAALLTGSLEARARFGTRAVPDDEKRAVARAAVDTFLHAFGAPSPTDA
ncbi:TetR/AcrR family transcriptional regulator [Frankia sp. CNm7]|uniref:TetR/AcrR family transcriptional regulator n=1 Tax=Frankia nepalensis TaxID=1836974 RepID=A0A937RGR3_9ACTN|nr:TetR/AcrR family transcriptional regulator [Frankia nepalensis]MBL7499011.1 TetR/AcrR family transcriptional regulator [Frankia nepalensis]MBL7515825.1 TetR/AcrR family transcriptional regulator [Frankia nepalensis]MBL7521410.1 TetR/AcrR family transcriptional regulator [Frankia nepalensis]MBL7626063.1 TetR/AcrR family transcriptional regulator [Frankia nepalensis]